MEYTIYGGEGRHGSTLSEMALSQAFIFQDKSVEDVFVKLFVAVLKLNLTQFVHLLYFLCKKEDSTASPSYSPEMHLEPY